MRTIGIDIDGVIADLNTPMCALYEKITGKKLITDNWHPHHEDGSDYSRDALDAVFNTPGLWESLYWFESALGTVLALQKLGDVYLHTAPPPTSENFYSERVRWVRKLFPQSREGKIPLVITEDKGLLRADFFVDDRLEHIRRFGMNNPKAKLYLVRRPWSFEGPPNDTRFFASPKSVVNYVNGLEEAYTYIRYELTGKFDIKPGNTVSFYYEGVPND